MSVGSLVSSGPLLLAIPVAAAAGAVTFLSPCVLPLVPGYLSYITGMSGTAVAPVRPGEPDDREVDQGGGADSATASGRRLGWLGWLSRRRSGDGDRGCARTARAASREPRPSRGRGFAVRARLLGLVRALRCRVRQPGCGPAGARQGAQPDSRDRADPARAAVRRRVRAVQRHRPDRQAVAAAACWPGDGARARRAVRARLDPVHRPDAERGAGAWPDDRHGRAGARSSRSSTRSASACRSCWSRSPSTGA